MNRPGPVDGSALDISDIEPDFAEPDNGPKAGPRKTVRFLSEGERQSLRERDREDAPADKHHTAFRRASSKAASATSDARDKPEERPRGLTCIEAILGRVEKDEEDEGRDEVN